MCTLKRIHTHTHTHTAPSSDMGPALNGHAQVVSEQKVNHTPTANEEPPHVGEEGRDGVEPPAIQERTSPGVCCDINDGYFTCVHVCKEPLYINKGQYS